LLLCPVLLNLRPPRTDFEATKEMLTYFETLLCTKHSKEHLKKQNGRMSSPGVEQEPMSLTSISEKIGGVSDPTPFQKVYRRKISGGDGPI